MSICEACGRPLRTTGCGRRERHHVCGFVHAPAVWIDTHTGCHSILTEAQRVAGVRLNRRIAHSELDTMWAMLAGFSAWIELRAWGSVKLDPFARLAGRLLAELAPGHQFGPDPIGTDRRRSKWHGKRVRVFWDDETGIAFVRAFAARLHDTMRPLLAPHEPPILRVLQEIANNPAAVFTRVSGMDRGEIARDSETLARSVGALIAATAGEITIDQAQAAVAPITELRERWLGGLAHDASEGRS